MSVKAVIFDYYGVINTSVEVINLSLDLCSKYKVALLTNASESLIPHLKQLGISDNFNGIFLSSRTGFVKPDTRAYENVCSQLEVKPKDAVMVDDSIGNVNGAIRAGLMGVHYQNLEQLKSELSKIGVEL